MQRVGCQRKIYAFTYSLSSISTLVVVMSLTAFLSKTGHYFGKIKHFLLEFELFENCFERISKLYNVC